MRRPRKAHQAPLSYLITAGETTSHTSQASDDYHRILKLVAHAVHAEISFIQIREKQLSARTLYHLTVDAARLTRDSATRLLINDRADIAVAGGADGVHLTTRSLTTEVIRRIFGQELVIGVSTHSTREASLARNGGADFVTFGPVYATPSKACYGPPVGLDALREAACELSPLPLVALGGVVSENFVELAQAGAGGVAAIRLFNQSPNLAGLVREIDEAFTELL